MAMKLFRQALVGTLAMGLSATAGTAACRASTAKADFYVSTAGSDAWSGRLAAPNERRTDGPFATIGRAEAAVREKGDGDKAVTVLVRGGMYFLDAPIVFGPGDSGRSAGAPVTYAAYPGELPIFSGGAPIHDWKMTSKGWWQTILPDVAAGKWNFEQLFVNGGRRYRTRLPRTGYDTVAAEIVPSPAAQGKGYDRFGYRPGDIRPDWANLGDVEVLAFHIWSMSRLRVQTVDDHADVVTFTGPTVGSQDFVALKAGRRFLVENVKEALGEPGSWYLDRPTGVLTYVPKLGERPARSHVVAPRLEQLLRFDGEATPTGRTVHDVVLRGLAFAYSNWVTPPGGNSFWQAEANLPAAITATGAERCVLLDCRVAHTGAWAVEWGAACRDDAVMQCDLIDLGAGGVKIGNVSVGVGTIPRTERMRIAGNNIVHGGRLHPAATGIWIGQSSYNRIDHNTIRDLYYTGVSVGWTWGYGPSASHNNSVAYNRISDLGQGVLSDMGGIYTLGVSPGTVLDHNWIGNVTTFDYGGWGIYFDEGSSGVSATNNVVTHVKSACFHQNYGRGNRLDNNFFLEAGDAPLQRTTPEDHVGFTIERNLMISDSGRMLTGNWSGDGYALDDNLYWTGTDASPAFLAWSWLDWRNKGQDRHSLFGDPRLANASGGDYALKPGSPAFKLGIRPIDIRTSGSGRPVDPAQAAPAFPL